MSRTRERFFKSTKPVEVLKTYKIDEFTTIKKLSNGIELVCENYSKEIESQKLLAVPQKIYRRLHPGGRQDCHICLSSAVKTEKKRKIK